MTYDFNSITEVMLASGSHSSPEEGMCAMEMVAWFDGEPHSDKPACASAALGAYVIRLNDRMPDEVRNRLLKPALPFVAGTFDPANEQARAEFLAMWAVNKVLPIILSLRGFADLATRCEAAKDLKEAKAAAYAAAKAAAKAAANAANADAAAADAAADAAANAADAAADAAHAAADAAHAAAYAAAYAADAARAADAEKIWQCAVDGLYGAIKIGRCDGFTLAPAVRHEALRELVKA